MTIQLRSTPAFDAEINHFPSLLMLLGGSLVSALLALLVWQQASGRRRAEVLAQGMTQDLQRERARLTNIIFGTNAGTWEWNAITGETRVNARWAEIAGYTLDERDFGRIETWRDLIHPQDQPRSQALLQQHFRGETPGYECENRIRHKDGHWVWVLGRGRLLERSADGRPMWVAGIHLDISQRKQAEIALRENENLMRLVIDNMGGRLAYFDSHARLQFANQATFDFFGGAEKNLIGCTFAELLGPGAMAKIGASIDKVLAGDPQNYELETTQADGHNTSALVHLVPDMRDGAVHGFVALAVDMTLAKRAEAEVRRADRLMRLAIDAIDAAVVLWDPDDRLVFCNDKYRELYSASADLIVPGVAFEDLIRRGAERGQYPQAVGREDEWVAERMAAHRAEHSELVQVIGDGRSLRVVERRLPDGHTVGFRIDITEQVKAAEAALAGSRAKSQFLANMSHEIRTPMNAILGLMALLRKTPLNERQTDYAIKAEKAARSLLGLLNDILDISKVESGKLALDVQPFRIDELLRDLSVILAANLAGKPVEVLYDIDPDLPALLEGDMMRLQQVLINLGGNAIKFTERGEVVVSVKVQERQADTITLAFSVRDTGVGVAVENQRHIFSGFSQAEASTTRRFGGTGLGLAISARLVDLMGGRLDIDSVLGQGSRFFFSITLPVPAQPVDAPWPVAQTLRVLVVDDNETARLLLTKLCAALGWRAEAAGNGSEALDMVAAATDAGQPWDVVLMDWIMPGMDGWETCQRLRRMPGVRSIPILLVTAHDREAMEQRGLQAPDAFNAILIKPVTPSMLRDAVRQALGMHPVEASPVPVPGSGARLAGMRLLVAEDNATNQMVVREMLEHEGAVVEIVADGAAAVQAVARAGNDFDAVLMDLQMPVMDGFTAAGRIRSDPEWSHLPIIAMTANALPSDRQASLAAGMNDHVGKPFDIDHLVQVLLGHCGKPDTRPGRAPTAAIDALRVPAHVALAASGAGIDAGAALRRLSGNLRLYHQLMRGVLPDLVAAPDRLRMAAGSGDTSAAVMLLHTLRGQVLTMGADQLAAALADSEKRLLDATGQAGLALAIAPALTAIENSQPGLQALLAALDRQYPDHRPHTDAEPVSAARVRQMLQELALQLRHSDMAATDTIQAMRLRFDEDHLLRLRPLEDAVHALEFDLAMRLCDDWLEAHAA